MGCCCWDTSPWVPFSRVIWVISGVPSIIVKNLKTGCMPLESGCHQSKGFPQRQSTSDASYLMVYLRRLRLIAMQRRSTNLLALEEQKNEEAKEMAPDDIAQTTDTEQSSQRKVKRVYEEVQNPREVVPLSEESGLPKMPEVQRRHTYQPINNSDESLFSMAFNNPKQLVYNNNSVGYKESLQRFIKDAGPVARIIVEERFLEYDRRMHINDNSNFMSLSTFSTESTDQNSNNDHRNSSAITYNEDPTIIPTVNLYGSGTTDILQINPLDDPDCQLQTDEVLTLFSQIGTPEFLEGSSSMAESLNQVNKSPGGKGSP